MGEIWKRCKSCDGRFPASSFYTLTKRVAAGQWAYLSSYCRACHRAIVAMHKPRMVIRRGAREVMRLIRVNGSTLALSSAAARL